MPETLPRPSVTIHCHPGRRIERHANGGLVIVLDGGERIHGDERGLTAEEAERVLEKLDLLEAGRN